MTARRAPARLIAVPAATVVRTRVVWLWPGRIAAGKVAVLDGDPGLGKSTVTLDIAARLSTGSPFPDGARPAPGNALVFSAEDDPGDTIRPRLEAHGADLERVFLGDEVLEADRRRALELPADIPLLEALLLEFEIRFLVIDPVVAYLAASVDAWRDQDVRRVLRALKEVAERTRAAIVILRHLNKSGGGNALYRGGGSIGIVGAARTGLLAVADPTDDTRRVLAVIKSNLAAKPEPWAYRLVPDERFDCGRVAWEGPCHLDAGELLGTDRDEGYAISEAEEIILEVLRDGPVPAKAVWAELAANHIAERTAKRAKQRIGVHSRRTFDGRAWEWLLPNAIDLTATESGEEIKGARGTCIGTLVPLAHAPSINAANGVGALIPPVAGWTQADSSPCVVCGWPVTLRDPAGEPRHPTCQEGEL